MKSFFDLTCSRYLGFDELSNPSFLSVVYLSYPRYLGLG